MLAPEELLDLRGVAEVSLEGVCDIMRKTRVRQPGGSWRDELVLVVGGVPCRKVPTGQTPQELAVMQTTLSTRAVATFILSGDYPVFATDVIRYPAVGGVDYGVAGVQGRTEGIYTRVIVYDESKAPTAP